MGTEGMLFCLVSPADQQYDQRDDQAEQDHSDGTEEQRHGTCRCKGAGKSRGRDRDGSRLGRGNEFRMAVEKGLVRRLADFLEALVPAIAVEVAEMLGSGAK